MINYPRLFERVYCNPVCITADRFSSIHSVLWPRMLGQIPLEMQAGETQPARNPYNGKRRTWTGPTSRGDNTIDPRMYYEPFSGVAVIPIYGVLAKNLSSWEESCGGGTDIQGPEAAVRQALAAADIGTIIFDIDSPGGEVTGIPEFGELVREASQQKTVYAFTDAQMCSAAYWIGSQAKELYCTKSSCVGSIGTYLAWLDPSLKLEKEGYTLQFFGKGKHKGIGLPGRALSKEDREMLENRVSEVNGWFQDAVTSARPNVESDTMEGQTFAGAESERRGLVDGVVSSWDEFLSLVDPASI